MTRGSAAFGLGVAVALAAGWLVFPRALYVRHAQPLAFRHQIHAHKSGMAQCTDCHVLRADGTFAGIPRLDSCATCHAEPMGTSQGEAVLVSQYIKKGREVPWQESYRQPANVWFSHAIHTQQAKLKCAECHEPDGQPDDVNRISGYNRRALTMSDCEDCHRNRHVEVSCLGCHQ